MCILIHQVFIWFSSGNFEKENTFPMKMGMGLDSETVRVSG